MACIFRQALRLPEQRVVVAENNEFQATQLLISGDLVGYHFEDFNCFGAVSGVGVLHVRAQRWYRRICGGSERDD